MIFYTIDTPDGILHFSTERKANAYIGVNPGATAIKHEIPVDTIKDLHKQSKKKIKPKCPTCGK